MALTDDLIAYWSLDEAEGLARADSVGSLDLAENSIDETGVGGSPGIVNGAASFVAVNEEYLSGASTAALQTGDIDFTIAVWARIDDNTNAYTIWSKWSTADSQREYMLDYASLTQRFRFLVSANGVSNSYVLLDALLTPVAGQWYLLIAWHDATANKIYIEANGSLQNEAGHSTGVYASSADMQLGASQNPGYERYLNGMIDEAGFWKRLLTPAERLALYNAGAGRNYPLA